MDELAQTRDNKTYLEFEEEIAKLDLLVIDDFGLMELDLDKCRDLLNPPSLSCWHIQCKGFERKM